MENSFGLINYGDAKVSTRVQYLLLLNDDCLMHIFKRLALLDLVNLSKTCVRLMNVAGKTFVRKYKSVSIDNWLEYANGYPTSVIVTKQQFSDVLSTIGVHVKSVEAWMCNDFILRTVINNCKNVNALKLFESRSLLHMSPHLQEIKNLKELLIWNCKISKKRLRQILLNNPGIEILKGNIPYNGFLKLLTKLPKLRRLCVSDLDVSKTPILFPLKELTKFEFCTKDNCNKFLDELATKSKLTELKFVCVINDETFNSVKLFENLEYLRVGDSAKLYTLPDDLVLSERLKHVWFNHIRLSHRSLTSFVKEHKLLEEIHLDMRYIITTNSDDSQYEAAIISGIFDAVSWVLEKQQRTLRIFCYEHVCHFGALCYREDYDNEKYLKDSKHLKILERVCMCGKYLAVRGSKLTPLRFDQYVS